MKINDDLFNFNPFVGPSVGLTLDGETASANIFNNDDARDLFSSIQNIFASPTIDTDHVRSVVIPKVVGLSDPSDKQWLLWYIGNVAGVHLPQLPWVHYEEDASSFLSKLKGINWSHVDDKVGLVLNIISTILSLISAVRNSVKGVSMLSKLIPALGKTETEMAEAREKLIPYLSSERAARMGGRPFALESVNEGVNWGKIADIAKIVFMVIALLLQMHRALKTSKTLVSLVGKHVTSASDAMSGASDVIEIAKES